MLLNLIFQDYSKTIAKTAADFEPTSRQGKNAGSTPAPGKHSALSTLGIKAPMVPQLDLCLRGGREGDNWQPVE